MKAKYPLKHSLVVAVTYNIFQICMGVRIRVKRNTARVMQTADIEPKMMPRIIDKTGQIHKKIASQHLEMQLMFCFSRRGCASSPSSSSSSLLFLDKNIGKRIYVC